MLPFQRVHRGGHPLGAGRRAVVPGQALLLGQTGNETATPVAHERIVDHEEHTYMHTCSGRLGSPYTHTCIQMYVCMYTFSCVIRQTERSSTEYEM